MRLHDGISRIKIGACIALEITGGEKVALVYPDDFNTAGFPAGTQIAVSRTFGIWTAVLFFLVLVCAVAIPWVIRYKTVNPFVIYVNAPNGDWKLIGHQTHNVDKNSLYVIQHSLVDIFTKKWFKITKDAERNTTMWGTCAREKVCVNRVLSTLESNEGCDLYCLSDDSVYDVFAQDVVPFYETLVSVGDTWNVRSIRVLPYEDITQSGGGWIVRGVINSSRSGEFDFVAYVKVARNITKYPQTLGFYVSDFYAYRE